MSPAPRDGFDEHEQEPWVVPRTSWTAADLLSAEFPEPRWAVPGVLPEGLSLLVGAPKMGKSWLSMNLAAAVAAGGRALGKVQVDQGEALYLALEDPPRRLQRRLQIVLENDPVPNGLHFETVWPLLHDGGTDQLDDWLDRHPDCRLVVVDVLARVRGTTSHREDKYEADYRCLISLKAVADKHRVALVVVHHTRKERTDDFLDSVSGTQGLAGAADSILVLDRGRGTADAKLHLTGRDVEEAEFAMSLKGGCWLLLDGPASDYDLGESRRQILNMLRTIGPKTPKQLSAALVMDHELVKKTCRRMEEGGQLHNAGGGTYQVPEGVSPVSLLSPEDGQPRSSDLTLMSLSPFGDTRDTRDSTPREAA